MKRNKNNLGIEIILILSAFICCILILSKAFVSARMASSEASVLSDAVKLASDCADVFLACGDENEILSVLNEAGNAKKEEAISVTYDEDLKPSAGGAFEVKIAIDEASGFATAKLSVFYKDEQVYEIETGRKARS